MNIIKFIFTFILSLKLLFIIKKTKASSSTGIRSVDEARFFQPLSASMLRRNFAERNLQSLRAGFCNCNLPLQTKLL